MALQGYIWLARCVYTPSTRVLRVTRPMRSYSYSQPGSTELEKCSWAGTQSIFSLVCKINLNVLNTWLAKQELPVRKIDIPTIFTRRTTPNISNRLSPLESVVRSHFLPKLVLYPVGDVERELFGLPVRFGVWASVVLP